MENNFRHQAWLISSRSELMQDVKLIWLWEKWKQSVADEIACETDPAADRAHLRTRAGRAADRGDASRRPGGHRRAARLVAIHQRPRHRCQRTGRRRL